MYCQELLVSSSCHVIEKMTLRYCISSNDCWELMFAIFAVLSLLQTIITAVNLEV